MSAITITKENFNNEVLNSDKPVLLDFWAGWCIPCRMFSPTVEKISKTETSVKVGKVNVDEQQDLARKYDVMSIPTLLLIKDGKVVKRSTGLKTASAVKSFIA